MTGHPALLASAPAYELERMPEGGGYPVGLIELAARLMDVRDMTRVVHLCSGSVRAPLAFDWRPPWGRLGCPDVTTVTPQYRWLERHAELVECPHDPPHPRSSGSSCSVQADARRLPIRDSSVRWVMVDPPYGQDYAEELWGLGKVYPTPAVILRECARILRPGGLVAFLHHVVPALPEALERVGMVHGVTTGPGYRIRALTIARRADVGLFG